MLSIDLREAIDGTRRSPCFSVKLFRLFLEADGSNFRKLAQAYPVHARMVSHYRATGEILEGLEKA